MKNQLQYVLRRMKKNKILLMLLMSVTLTMCVHDSEKDISEWKQDIDILVGKIEQYHPEPWKKTNREVFLNRAQDIKENLRKWDNEKIVIEIMKLVGMIRDGHTQVKLLNQNVYSLWFPIRIEKFYDGLFITATDNDNSALLGAKVLKIGSQNAYKAYSLVGEIIASDSDHSITRTAVNYLSNAVILENLGIIETRSQMNMEIILPEGIRQEVILKSATWDVKFNWAYNTEAAPTNNEIKTVFEDKSDSLPLFLSRVVPSRDPYWFKYIPEDRMIYFQYNDVTNWSREPFADFTKRLFGIFDDNVSQIDKFIIDLRFNEGGDGSLLPPLVREFVLRTNSLHRGKLFIITGSNTFSAAPNFIGQMLRNTSAITVGDIAGGPLNWCSDIIKFTLPNSNLMVNISTMAWQLGHPTDNRGYYPPDYYIPTLSTDYFSFADPVLEAIKIDEVKSMKDILFNEGCDKFWSAYQKRKKAYGAPENWFPYNSFDLLLYAFQTLAPAGKIDEALAISELNTILYPEDVRAWYMLAMIQEAKGNLQEALESFDKLLSIEPYYVEAKWDRDKIKALADPQQIEASILNGHIGQYGVRSVILEDNFLYYQRSGGSKLKLIPISEDYFLIEGSSTRIKFIVESDTCNAIKLLTYIGSSATYIRSQNK